MPALHGRESSASLLDLRDELALATRLVAALSLATQAPHLPEAERRALCELATLCRERLEDCIEEADALLSRQRDGLPKASSAP